MAEKSEVIQSDIEETRSSLADKLSQLGEKVAGTVETVEETVESVTETAENTVEAVKDTFNFSLQMERRPWLILGGAALLGFVGGRLLFPGSSEEPRDWDSDRAYRDFVNGRAGNGRSEREAADMTERMSQAAESGPTTDTAERSEGGWFSGDWLGGFTDKMGPEMETLKGMALGAAFGLVRDMVARNLPDSLTSEISNLFDDMTERAGGKPVQGAVLGSSDAESAEGAKGAEGEQRQEEEEQEASSESEPEQKNRGKKRGKNHRLAHR